MMHLRLRKGRRLFGGPSAGQARGARRRAIRPELLEDRSLLSLGFSLAQGLGGSGTNTAFNVEITDLTTDSAGNTYISGSFENSVNFDPAATKPGNTGILTSSGLRDGFVAKYAPNGAFLWARSEGGPAGDDRAIALATDSAGNVYATGFYSFTASFGPGLTLNSTNAAGIFVWKLDTNGTPIWAVGPAGAQHVVDQGYGIVVDGSGNIDLTGSFRSSLTWTTSGGPVTMVAGGTNDPFVARLNPSGTFLWAKPLTITPTALSPGFGQGIGIASDPSGNVYATGFFSGQINLNPGGSDIHTTQGGQASLPSNSAFVVKLDNSGNFQYGKSYNSLLVSDVTTLTEGYGIAVDGSGNAYITGRFTAGTNFDPSQPVSGTNTITPPAGYGMFALKLNSAGGFGWVTNLNVSNTAIDIGRPSVGLDGSGNAYFGGQFLNTAAFGPTVLTSAGDSDVYVAKLNAASGTILDATRGGGAGPDHLEGLAVAPTGTILIAGNDVAPASFGAYTLPPRGTDNAFFATVVNRTPIRPVQGSDYDGDHKADLAVYRPSTAQWLVYQSTAGPKPFNFGAPVTDIPVPGDYDGDGKADLAVFRPSTDQWFIQFSSGGSEVIQFGGPGDLPVQGDYDGDGKTDIAVFRPSTAQWFILQSTAGPKAVQFGGPGDVPVPADYDGDGLVDIAVYRPSQALWLIQQSTAGPRAVFFGQPNLDQPIPADYDGDGKADLAVLRPDSYTWLIQLSGGGAIARQFGGLGDFPMPADYDGDGKADLAVYRPSTATWYISQSSAGPRAQAFGQPFSDFPMTAPLQYRYFGGGRTAVRAQSLASVGSSNLITPLGGGDSSAIVTLPGSSSSTTRTRRTLARDLALSSAIDELEAVRRGDLGS